MTIRGGFTLVELAVALLIIAVLLAGALIPLSTQVELRSIADTQRTMDEIKEALYGFAQVNGRLPCPANGSVAVGTSGAGTEQWDGTNSRCTTVLGVLPWSTLGVSETDAWGRRFTYRVSPVFADAIANNTIKTQTTTTPASPANQTPDCSMTTPPANSSLATCTLGDIAVLKRDDSTHNCSVQAQSVPVIVISHGRNGYGAYKPDGLRHTGTGDFNADGVPDQNADEAANATGTSTASCTGASLSYTQYVFFSRNPASYAATCSDATAGSPLCEFDDVVIWVSQPLLVSKMVSAGRLP